jgi:hypothetical protein
MSTLDIRSTLASAKAITSAYVANGKVTKPTGGAGVLFTDDGGQTDLAKTQLLAWTTVAIVVYPYVLCHSDATKGLPDIDGAIMVLMGLGHGAYVGKKLVTTDSGGRDLRSA